MRGGERGGAGEFEGGVHIARSSLKTSGARAFFQNLTALTSRANTGT